MIPPLIDPHEKWYRRFAWFPKRSTVTQRWIWMQHYWHVEVWMDSWGNQPIRDLTWNRIMTENELLIERIKYPK